MDRPAICHQVRPGDRGNPEQQDPDNAAYYEKNLEAFTKQAHALADAMRADQQSVPDGDLKLLTYHDAYAYFAKDVRWQIIGAVQPKNFEDPTPQEVAALIDQVKAEHVPDDLGSEVFPSNVLEEIGKRRGPATRTRCETTTCPARRVTPEHSWLGLMRTTT